MIRHKDVYDRETTPTPTPTDHTPTPALDDDVENSAVAQHKQPKERKIGLYMAIGLLVCITGVRCHLPHFHTLAHEAPSWLLSPQSSW